MSIHSITLKGHCAIIEESNKMYLDLGVSQSRGNEYIFIKKDLEWEDTNVVIVFTRPDGEQMDIPFVTDTIEVPYFITKLHGQGKATFIGYKSGVRILAIDMAYYCHKHQNIDLDPASSEPQSLTEQLLEAAKEATDVANSVRKDADDGKFDGFSPIIDVEDIENGHKISITDKDKTSVVEVLNGEASAGISAGGKQGQVLSKKSNEDYDTEWINQPTKLSELKDDTEHRIVTDEQIEAWNNKSDFSGDYNDLKNKPEVISSGYIVTINDEESEITSDRSALAIKSAIEAGQIVIAKTIINGNEDYFRLYKYEKINEEQYTILFTNTFSVKNGLRATTYSLTINGETEIWGKFSSFINPVQKTATMTQPVGIDSKTGNLFIESVQGKIKLVTFITSNDGGVITVAANETMKEIKQALDDNLFVYGHDLTENVYYNLSECLDDEIIFSAVSKTKINIITVNDTGAEFYKKPEIKPVEKTSVMTIPVGIDEDGKLWTSASGASYNIGDGLKFNAETNTVSVDTANSVEQNNIKPVTSTAVFTVVGNIDVLLNNI